MKAIKGFLSFLIGLSLMLVVGALTTSFLLKDVFQNQLVGSVVRTEMISEAVDNSDFKGKNEVNELIDDKELQDLINDVVEEYINAVDDEDYEISEKTVDSIIDYVVDHKDELEKITGEEIDVDRIKSKESKDELTKAMNDSFKEIKDADSSVKTLIKGYGFITSAKFRAILIAIIIVSILLLALIKGSMYDWLSTAGISLIACGVFISALYAVVSALLKAIANESEVTVNINPTNIIIIGIIEIGLGILLIVVKSIIKKSFDKKEDTTTKEIDRPVEDKKEPEKEEEKVENNE